MKTARVDGAVINPRPMNPASTVYPDYEPVGRAARMDVKAVLPLKIGLFPGWRVTERATDPTWSGTVEEFWADNEELTWGDIRRMIADLEDEGRHLMGGGAAPACTVQYVTR